MGAVELLCGVQVVESLVVVLAQERVVALRKLGLFSHLLCLLKHLARHFIQTSKPKLLAERTRLFFVG